MKAEKKLIFVKKQHSKLVSEAISLLLQSRIWLLRVENVRLENRKSRFCICNSLHNFTCIDDLLFYHKSMLTSSFHRLPCLSSNIYWNVPFFHKFYFFNSLESLILLVFLLRIFTLCNHSKTVLTSDNICCSKSF